MTDSLTPQELTRRVDALMAEATRLQDEGKSREADAVIAEAENLEDQYRDQEWDLTP